MKNVKDRTIRIENIPDDKLVYQVIESFRYTGFLIFLFGLSMVMLNTPIFIIVIVLVFIYMFLSLIYKVKLEVRESFIVHFLDDNNAEIIYYNEVINYQVIDAEQKDFHLKILTKDETEYVFILQDNNVAIHLDELMGDKRVGK